MNLSERIRSWIALASLIVGVTSLILTVYNRSVLSARLDSLQRDTLFGLFQIEKPDLRNPLPARQETILHGTYVNKIPDGYDVRAVLYLRGEYYVSRSLPLYGLDRKWELAINPWPGEWELYLCLTDDEGTKEMDKWAGEKKADGSLDWGNARSKLPEGVFRNSMFEFSAIEKSNVKPQTQQQQGKALTSQSSRRATTCEVCRCYSG